MRKLAIAVGIIVVLAVIVVAALPFVLDVNKYRPRIQAELQQRTGRPVTLGKMDLKVFPFAFKVENAAIAEDRNFPQARPFAQIQELLVSAKLLPLLHGDVEVNSIELVNPKIELIRNQQGVWNFSSLGKQQQAAAPAQPAPKQPAPPTAQQQPAPEQQKTQAFTLEKLAVQDGQIAFTDLQKNRPRAIYDHIDLELNDYAPQKPFSGTLTAHLPGQGKETIQIKGQGGPLRNDDVAATDFKGTLKLDQVSLAALQRFLNVPALQGVAFSATGDANIAANNGNVTSDGSLKLESARVHGVDVGYPISADYQIKADLNKNVFNVQKGLLKLDQTPLSITGDVNAAPTPAQVDLKLTATNASIAEAARLAAAFGVAFNPGMQINGRLDANLSARGSMDKPVLNGSAGARELVIKGKDLPQEVHITNVNLALTPESVRSNEFMASTGSTAVKINFALNNYASNASTLDATVAAPSAQLGELLNIAKAYGVSAVDGMSGSGPVSLNVRVQGPIKNPAAMAYNGAGKLQNASLSVPELTKPIQVKNADLRFTQNSAVLENAAFSVGSTNANGQVTLKGMAPNATPETQFSLSIDKLDIAELQQMIRTAPQSEPAPKRASATGLDLVPTAEAQARGGATPAKSAPLMQRLVGSGNVQVGSITYDQVQYSNAKSTVKLDHGVIRMDPFTAQVFGGTQSGTVVIDTRPAQTTYAVSSKLDRVDANKLLSSVSSAKEVLYGLLTANANTSFVTSSSSDIARSLNGTVSLNLQNGKIAHIDLLNQLASIGKFAQSGKSSEPFTNVAKLTADFKINNGVAHTDDLKAVIDGGTLAADGAVNLVDQSLNLRLMAVLSKDYSQTVGGTQVGGYLSTALANAKGELVMPVLVTGTFAQPRVAPDVQRLAQMKMENLLPSTSNPGGLTTGILNSVLGQKNGSTDNSGSQQGQQKGVRGILDQLSGGQSNKQTAPANPNNPDNSGTGTSGTTNQPAQPKPQPNGIMDIFNAVTGQQKKQPAQQQPAPEQKQPAQEPPK